MKIIFLLLCCLLVSGCQDISVQSDKENQIVSEIITNGSNDMLSDSINDNNIVKSQDIIIDFDGDGTEDNVELSIVENEYAKVTVVLGSGKSVERRFPGWWWFVDHETGRDSLEPTIIPTCDFDDDGLKEMLIQLAFAGSSGPDREIHILKIKDNELIELPLEYKFPNNLYEQVEFTGLFENINSLCWGAQIFYDGTYPMLRVKHWDMNTSDRDGAWYMDCVFSGQHWIVQRLTWSKLLRYESDIE